MQNQVQQAISRLPQQVQQQGVRVTKSNPDFLLIVAVYDETDQRTNMDVSDYLVVQHPGPAVARRRASATSTCSARRTRCASGSTRSASRLLADAERRRHARSRRRTPRSRPARSAACRSADGQMLNATVTAQSRLQTPEQFQQHHPQDRAERRDACACSDVARVELGAENYNAIIRVNGHPGAGIAISLAPGRRRAEDRRAGQGRGRRARAELPRRASTTPTPTTPPTSSSCRSTRS